MAENTLPMVLSDQPSPQNSEQARQSSAQGQESSTGNLAQRPQTGQRTPQGRRPLFRR